MTPRLLRVSVRWCIPLVAWVLAAMPNAAQCETPAGPGLVPGAAVPWHRSCTDARQAAAVSHRPVIVICFSSSGESGTALARDVFSSPEAIALLTACFEPVRVDVDADPSTARALGISRVPTACIIDEHGRSLACFECPLAPAAFVAAASRAAQDAATAQASGAASPPVAVRERSDFPAHASPAPTAAAIPHATPFTAQEPAAGEEPALSASPPTWPAQPASRPLSSLAETTPPARPVLEPAAATPRPTPAPSGAEPWLGSSNGASPAGIAPPAPPAGGTAAASEPAAESNSFLTALQKPFAIFSKPKAAADAKTPTSTVAAAAEIASDPNGSMPLGLEGYCPVSLIDKGTWVEGRAQWGARHRGRTYLFAGPEQQRAFLADPDRYAPALSGDDPVLACDSGRQVTGQRRYGVTYQSRTYLFSSPDTRAAFAANPQRYTSRVAVAERPASAGTVTR